MFVHRDAQEKTCWRRFPPALVLGNIIALTAVATIVLRRRGYGIGGNTIVRCGERTGGVWHQHDNRRPFCTAVRNAAQRCS
jgi:hypothetical protein